MSDYDLNKLANPQENMPNNEEPEKQPQLLMAFLAGLGASVIVGGVLALLGILLEAEYIIFLIIP